MHESPPTSTMIIPYMQLEQDVNVLYTHWSSRISGFIIAKALSIATVEGKEDDAPLFGTPTPG